MGSAPIPVSWTTMTVDMLNNDERKTKIQSHEVRMSIGLRSLIYLIFNVRSQEQRCLQVSKQEDYEPDKTEFD